MVPDEVVLYSLRSQGWVYNNGGYGSLAAEARIFTEDEAIAYAKRALPIDGPSNLIPVPLHLLNSIRNVKNVER